MPSNITDRLSGTPGPAADDLVTGLGPGVAVKVPCRVVATANITLSGLQTIDGVSLSAGDRVLAINQTSSINNGIYIASSGAWSRAPDFESARDAVKGTRVHIVEGAAGARKEYFVTSANPVNIGTDALTFDIRAVDESAAAVDFAAAETVASASTTDIGAADSNTVTVSGTETIDSFGTADAGVERWLRFTGAGDITHSASILGLPGGATITRAVGDTMHVKSEGSGVWRCYAFIRASGLAAVLALPAGATDNRLVKTDAALGKMQQSGITCSDDDDLSGIRNLNVTGTFPLPKGHLYGLTLSNDAGDTDHDIRISTGEAQSDTTPRTLQLASSYLIKRIDAAWAVGTEGGSATGGLDTGTVQSDTTYHVWIIGRTDGTHDDVLFSASATAPTMPTGYTFKRRIGAVITDGSADILAFKQIGDEFLLKAPVLDVNDDNPGTSAVLRTLTVPAGINVLARLNVGITTGSNGSFALSITSPDQTDTAVENSTIDGAALIGLLVSLASNDRVAGQASVMTDTSRRVRSRLAASASDMKIYIETHGWVDTRGRLAA